jgi:hypothetical protein
MAVVPRRSWPRILCRAASEMPFCSAVVTNVCLEHAWHHVLGDAGALGDPFDDLLYRAQTNEPALIQGEVRNHSGNGRNPDGNRGRFGSVILN